jgi:hypothetical protein
MGMRVAIFGDSFATIDRADSWASQLAREFKVDNFAQRGVSEYRIYKSIQQRDLTNYNHIIVFHTNPDRVFVPDHVTHPSRTLQTHPYCDMLANDSLDKVGWADIVKGYYKNFYDQQFQDDLFDLLLDRLFQQCQSAIHCTGFDLSNTHIHSFFTLRQTNPGNINHLDTQGNSKIYQYIKERMV